MAWTLRTRRGWDMPTRLGRKLYSLSQIQCHDSQNGYLLISLLIITHTWISISIIIRTTFSYISEHSLWGPCLPHFILCPPPCQGRVCRVPGDDGNFKTLYEGGDSHWGVMAARHLARALYLLGSTGPPSTHIWCCYGNSQLSHDLHLWWVVLVLFNYGYALLDNQLTVCSCIVQESWAGPLVHRSCPIQRVWRSTDSLASFFSKERYCNWLTGLKIAILLFLWKQVIPKLAQFAPYLLTAPVTMMKKWSKWVNATTHLVGVYSSPRVHVHVHVHTHTYV